MPKQTANASLQRRQSIISFNPSNPTNSIFYSKLAHSLLHNTISHMNSSADFQLKSIKARSRRKRKPTIKCVKDHAILTINEPSSASLCCMTPATINLVSIPSESNNKRCSSSSSSSQRAALKNITHLSQFCSMGRFSTVLTYAAILVLSATCTTSTYSPCDSNHWWDPVRNNCIPCTTCEGDMIPLRPCQMHLDTICGSIYDLKIDWVVLAKTEHNWKERRKAEESNYNLEQQMTHEEIIQLDWQTAALFVAVFACLLFFIVAACILIHHMRQWRRMERRLDQDVEELSTKLMAKLAEVQGLEGGTFFIGTADALRVPTLSQPHHVLLPEKTGKHHDRRVMRNMQPGNVYIEESSSKG